MFCACRAWVETDVIGAVVWALAAGSPAECGAGEVLAGVVYAALGAATARGVAGAGGGFGAAVAVDEHAAVLCTVENAPNLRVRVSYLVYAVVRAGSKLYVLRMDVTLSNLLGMNGEPRQKLTAVARR